MHWHRSKTYGFVKKHPYRKRLFIPEALMKIHFLFTALVLTLSLSVPAAGKELQPEKEDLGYTTEELLITTAHYPDGKIVPYILNSKNVSPRYVIILFPGGNGVVNPHLEEGLLVYEKKGNFLLRARTCIVDNEFATVTTDSSHSEERIQGVLEDIKNRFPTAKIYLMGTSNGTYDTMALAEYLSDKIAGEIHTSSLSRISSFDASKYKNRHLMVHHKEDWCKATPFDSAKYSHENYKNELIVMEGGITRGDWCQPFAHHGFNGIEQETVNAIKQWIKRYD
jgi:predicted alpha/beta-fold hydrolase